MELLQECDVEDRKTGAHSEPEGHGDQSQAYDNPTIIESWTVRDSLDLSQLLDLRAEVSNPKFEA
jgi:hypothetical protein